MAAFQPIGVVYAMLLESVVYPYILSSLIVGLGSLAASRARDLFRASWMIYLFLWLVVLVAISILVQAFPPAAPPVEIKPAGAIGVLALIRTVIPENLTAALSNNLVPAIVVFAVLFGAAVQSVPAKSSFLESVEAIRLASLKIWQWVVYLAPVGVFALFASTAGTIEPRMAGSLAVYFALFLIGSFALAFVLFATGPIDNRARQCTRAAQRSAAGLCAGAGDDVADVSVAAHPGCCRTPNQCRGLQRRRG
jgi:Na+/H+-dicarboxylate symporter